jgi:hypothetical protein
MDASSAIQLGTAVVGAGASIYGAVQGAQAAAAERGQIELERQQTELQALDAENERRAELRRSMSAQAAAAAAMGIGTGPGTSFSAIQNEDRRQNEREIRQIRLNAYMAGRGYKAADRAAKSAGISSLVGGFADASGTLLNYGLQRYQLMTPDGKLVKSGRKSPKNGMGEVRG